MAFTGSVSTEGAKFKSRFYAGFLAFYYQRFCWRPLNQNYLYRYFIRCKSLHLRDLHQLCPSWINFQRWGHRATGTFRSGLPYSANHCANVNQKYNRKPGVHLSWLSGADFYLVCWYICTAFSPKFRNIIKTDIDGSRCADDRFHFTWVNSSVNWHYWVWWMQRTST